MHNYAIHIIMPVIGVYEYILPTRYNIFEIRIWEGI